MRTRYVTTLTVLNPVEHFLELRKNYINALSSASHTDLQLAAQDGGLVWVHQCVILPLSPWLANIVQEVACCDYPKVILDCMTKASLAAVLDLLYTSRCHLSQEVSEDSVLEAMDVLGVRLSRDCFKVVESVESAVLDLRRRSGMTVEPVKRKQQEGGEQEVVAGSRRLWSSISRRKKGSTQETKGSRQRNKMKKRDKMRPIRSRRWARDGVMDAEDVNTDSKTSISFPTQSVVEEVKVKVDGMVDRRKEDAGVVKEEGKMAERSNVICEGCKSVFTQAGSLQHHLAVAGRCKRMKKLYPQELKCHRCFRRFNSKSHFSKHVSYVLNCAVKKKKREEKFMKGVVKDNGLETDVFGVDKLVINGNVERFNGKKEENFEMGSGGMSGLVVPKYQNRTSL